MTTSMASEPCPSAQAAALLAPAGTDEVCEALLPLLPVFVELVGCDDVGPAALASQCAESLARCGSAVAPSMAGFIPPPRAP